MPQARYGEQFLHEQDRSLHRSLPVELEQIRRERASHDADYLTEESVLSRDPDIAPEPSTQTTERGALVPSHSLDSEPHTKPAQKIEDWLKVLKHTHEGHPDDPRVLERIKDSYHKRYIIKPENVPESAFELEARIARQQGYGDIAITDTFREDKANEIISNQEASLDRWLDYLTSEDASYPTWLKYWAFTSITKMGKFEKTITTDRDGREHESARFAGRTADTVAPFPQLNQRALALTLEAMREKAAQRGVQKHGVPKDERFKPSNKSDRLSDVQYAQLVATESFSKLYAQFLIELPAYSAEGLRETRGRWIKYDQGSDAHDLVSSLEGYPLEWCTAEYETAMRQLEGGDFYVYYSLDEDQTANIPRVAIRMQNNRIAEVRGIAHDQHLDPYIAPVVEAKLEDFPDGEAYQVRVADMERITKLEESRVQGQSLAIDDLRFLYQIDRDIEDLGYGEDPRVYSLLKGRDWLIDMKTIFDTDSPDYVVHELIKAGKAEALVVHLDRFEGLNRGQLVHDLIMARQGWAVVKFLDKFEGLDHGQLIRTLAATTQVSLVAKDIEKFRGLDHNLIAHELIAAGQAGGWAVAENLSNFRGLDHNLIAHELIAAGWAGAVSSNLENFKELDATVAHELIAAGKLRAVSSNLENFKGLDAMVAHELIAAGKLEAVSSNLENFKGLDAMVAHELIAAGKLEAVLLYFGRFKGLDAAVAHELIAARKASVVALDLHKFEGLDAAVAHELIAAGQEQAVVAHLDRFGGLNRGQLVHELIMTGKARAVASNLENLRGLDAAVAHELIAAGESRAVVRNLNKFKGLDYNLVAYELIMHGWAGVLSGRLGNFKELDATVAHELIAAGQGLSVAKNIERFNDPYGMIHDMLRHQGIIG